MQFPSKVFNFRVITCINHFFEDWNVFLKKFNLTSPSEVKKVLDNENSTFSWESDDFLIKVTGFHPIDHTRVKAIKRIEILMKTIPSVVSLESNKYFPLEGRKKTKFHLPKLRFGNSYTIDLPRSYPANVGNIRIIYNESHWHPRFDDNSFGNQTSTACYHPNGEIDRILMDVVFFLMYEPGQVKPPGSDNGLNHEATMWFLNAGPNRVHKYIFSEWVRNRYKLVIGKNSSQ